MQVLKRGWFSDIIQVRSFQNECITWTFNRGSPLREHWKRFELPKDSVITIKVPREWKIQIGDTLSFDTVVSLGFTHSLNETYGSGEAPK